MDIFVCYFVGCLVYKYVSIYVMCADGCIGGWTNSKKQKKAGTDLEQGGGDVVEGQNGAIDYQAADRQDPKHGLKAS
jgi:hypothetical protein